MDHTPLKSSAATLYTLSPCMAINAQTMAAIYQLAYQAARMSVAAEANRRTRATVN